MKKEAVVALELVREIARATNQPEALVLAAYDEVTLTLKRDARIMDFVPLFAARRVRETMKTREPVEQAVK